MKLFHVVFWVFFLASCTNHKSEKNGADKPLTSDSATAKFSDSTAKLPSVDSNEVFKDVKARQIVPHKFKITGKARVFEAAFSWYIEDGHNVLAEGHETTEAGAPEWGNFSFTVNAIKDIENSTVHIILYEASAKDGSKQHQLAVKLY